MGVNPIKIGVECADQLVGRFPKIVAVPKEDISFRFSRCFGRSAGVQLACDNWHDLFVMRCRMRDFATAHT